MADTQRLTAPPSVGVLHHRATFGDARIAFGAVAAQPPTVQPPDERLDLIETGAGAKAVELERGGIGGGLRRAA